VIASAVALVNNNDSPYLMMFTSLLHIGFDRVNDNNLIFKTTNNHNAKWTFMLPPYFFLNPAVVPPLLKF